VYTPDGGPKKDNDDIGVGRVTAINDTMSAVVATSAVATQNARLEKRRLLT